MKLITAGIWVRMNQHRCYTPITNWKYQPTERFHNIPTRVCCFAWASEVNWGLGLFWGFATSVHYPLWKLELLLWAAFPFLRRLPLFLLVLWPTNCCSPVVWVGTWVSPQQNWQCPREAVSLIQWSPSKQSLKQCKPQDPGLTWQVPENHKLWVFNSAPVPETTTSTRSTQCQSR